MKRAARAEHRASTPERSTSSTKKRGAWPEHPWFSVEEVRCSAHAADLLAVEARCTGVEVGFSAREARSPGAEVDLPAGEACLSGVAAASFTQEARF